MTYGKKVFLLSLQCFALMIGSLMLYSIISERENLNHQVSREIIEGWGPSLTLSSPTLKSTAHHSETVEPAQFDCSATVNSQTLHRGIYEAQVFTADVSVKGIFSTKCLETTGPNVTITVPVSTPYITELGKLNIDGRELDWDMSQCGLYKTIRVSDLSKPLTVSTSFTVRGSQCLEVKKSGDRCNVSIEGEAVAPSFQGDVLPVTREVHGNKFNAEWSIICLTVGGERYTGNRECVGVNFLVGLDRYQKVDRSLKYAFLIIVLTYVSVLITEIFMKRQIPMLNYFLIGAALIIFYTLLLSFVELVPFGWAYLIAAAMTVALVSAYMCRIMKSRWIGAIIGAVLAIIYVSCYIMLVSSTYALLFGSLALFLALATMMYASTKIPMPI